jgi:hypothetical protein
VQGQERGGPGDGLLVVDYAVDDRPIGIEITALEAVSSLELY